MEKTFVEPIFKTLCWASKLERVSRYIQNKDTVYAGTSYGFIGMIEHWIKNQPFGVVFKFKRTLQRSFAESHES